MRRYLLTMADLRRSSAKKCRPATLYPGTCDVMAPDLRHQSLRPAVGALSSIDLVPGRDKNAVKCAWPVPPGTQQAHFEGKMRLASTYC